MHRYKQNPKITVLAEDLATQCCQEALDVPRPRFLSSHKAGQEQKRRRRLETTMSQIAVTCMMFAIPISTAYDVLNLFQLWDMSQRHNLHLTSTNDSSSLPDTHTNTHMSEPAPEMILLKQETVSCCGISWAIRKSASRPLTARTVAILIQAPPEDQSLPARSCWLQLCVSYVCTVVQHCGN